MSNEFYPTDSRATHLLIKYGDIPRNSNIVEACYGQGAIANELKELGYTIWSNELYYTFEKFDSRYNINSKTEMELLRKESKSDILITNPPFSSAWNLLVNTLDLYKYIALYLPINFLEPTEERWNDNTCRPNRIIVMPRFSHTDDGQKDKKTCFWGIWGVTSNIVIVSKNGINNK